MKQIKRGEIWYVNLDPTVGDEANKQRPCLIVQNNLGNLHSRKTIVVPFLKPNKYPFVVVVKASKTNNLDRDRGLDVSHIRSVSQSRIANKLGELENVYWEKIKKAVLIQLGFDEMFD
ncbi:MAG: type II toxin-antitoxin system PemK/MazF family toxin [Xenococcaceae cyanobacterium MO_167.B52]|nr:type II toxin-antitoxin system PemK/MazF family toxin [Xenococcaceae cyanobacterium MO_167.B52]